MLRKGKQSSTTSVTSYVTCVQSSQTQRQVANGIRTDLLTLNCFLVFLLAADFPDKKQQSGKR